MSAITIAPPPRLRELPARRSVAVLVQRNARKTLRVPALLTFGLAMPLLMLVLFSQVFRTVEDSPGFPAGVSYIDFLLPAALAAAVMMNASNAGVGIAIDLNAGVVDRIRSLPVRGWTVLAARTITDTVLSMAGMAIVTVVAAASTTSSWPRWHWASASTATSSMPRRCSPCWSSSPGR